MGLYNEGLGTTSDVYQYDRLRGREAPQPHPPPPGNWATATEQQSLEHRSLANTLNAIHPEPSEIGFEKYPYHPKRSVISKAVKDPRLYFHGGRWSTIPWNTAIAFSCFGWNTSPHRGKKTYRERV